MDIIAEQEKRRKEMAEDFEYFVRLLTESIPKRKCLIEEN